MAQMDEFRAEREAIKSAGLKTKIAYFWEYYKWHSIVAVALLASMVFIIHSCATNTKSALYVAMINTLPHGDAEVYAEEVAERLHVNAPRTNVVFDLGMYMNFDDFDTNTAYAAQKMMVLLASGDADLMITNTKSLEYYAYNDTMCDLRDIMTPEQIEKYEPYFFYLDAQVLRDKMEADNNLDITYEVPYPEDPSDPTTMAEPIPVGVYVDGCSELMDRFYFHEGRVALSVIASAKHVDLGLQYLDLLFEEQ